MSVLGWQLFYQALYPVTAFVLLAVHSGIVAHTSPRKQWAVIPRSFLSMSKLKGNGGRSALYISNGSDDIFPLTGRSVAFISDGSVGNFLVYQVDRQSSSLMVGRQPRFLVGRSVAMPSAGSIDNLFICWVTEQTRWTGGFPRLIG